ncbi:MAG: hypothetical protein WEB58_09175 [Planctomycetaceae bacterium]
MNQSPDRFKIIADRFATLLLGAGVGFIALTYVANPMIWAWAFLGVGSFVKIAVLNEGHREKQSPGLTNSPPTQ